jgi:hypothetical protein
MTVTQKEIEEISIQIEHTERKIEIMGENGFFGEIIDNFVGNNIETEKKRLKKLQALKQKKTTALKFTYLKGKEEQKKNVDNIKLINSIPKKTKTPKHQKDEFWIDNNDYDDYEEEYSIFKKLRYLFSIVSIILGFVCLIGLKLGYSLNSLENAGYYLLQIVILILVILSFILKSN